MTLQWQVADGVWRNLLDGTNVFGSIRFDASGVHLTTLDLASITTQTDLRFRCAVTNGYGTVNSQEGLLRVCPADFNCDGGVDGDDVIAFFDAWDSSSPEGDFNGDEGVDGDDVIAFFARWDANC
jgi:hypothetical protein